MKFAPWYRCISAVGHRMSNLVAPVAGPGLLSALLRVAGSITVSTSDL